MPLSQVLYGGQLPAAFEENASTDGDAMDLLIVAGTSLTVYPAAGIPDMVGRKCKRAVCDLNKVKGFRYSAHGRDVLLQGEIDETALALIEKLGWLEDLRPHRDRMCEASAARVDRALGALGAGAGSAAAAAAEPAAKKSRTTTSVSCFHILYSSNPPEL